MPYEDSAARMAHEHRARRAKLSGHQYDHGQPVQRDPGLPYDYRSHALFYDQTDEEFSICRPEEA